MNQNTQSKIADKISEDISPTRNLKGLHLKIVFGIAILWTFFQLWYASPFPFWFNIGMFKGLPARAIHLGFALTLTFLIFPIARGKKISIYDILISLVAAFCCLYISIVISSLIIGVHMTASTSRPQITSVSMGSCIVVIVVFGTFP